jgi:serine/threonine-protein kinase
MGKVWTAEHLSLHSAVAVKLLDDELSTRPEAVARFLREARAAAQIRSPHIVQVFDVGIDNGVPFIAMELLQGESLAERLERVRRLSPADTARFLSQVARGIARAHGVGLVHRDLKPDNVFLERNDEDELAKVLDFGVAKTLLPGFDGESGATRSGVLIGSPHYMSPEQAEASSALDQRTDVWSFGVMAFECLTGMKPFNQASLGSQVLAICAWPIPIPSQVAEVPIGFDAWFARACSRSLSGRFGSIQEAAQQLTQVCTAATEVGSRTAPRASASVHPNLATTQPGTGPRSDATPRSDSLRAVATASSLPPRFSLNALPRRARLLSAGAFLVLLVSTLLVWKLMKPAPMTEPAKTTVTSVPAELTKPTPIPASTKPSVGAAAGGTSVPLSPAPAGTKPATVEARGSARQQNEEPLKLKKLSPRQVPKRTRGSLDMKEDPY